MDYKVTINDFEGPMDLLLHLIKKEDVDIRDISIEEITKQYLEFINQMEEMNLNVASEYLIMAAELLEIKSAILLPRKEVDLEEEEDPRETLINRLIEYKRYKEVTGEFKELEENRKNYFTKSVEDLSSYRSEDEELDLGDVDLDKLLDAFSKFLARKQEEKPLNTKISTKEYSVKERSDEIRTILRKKKNINFEELFEVYKKDYVVVTFLSILNLARKQELEIKQEDNFDKIYLSYRGE
ncbi:MAG: segregation/condensation protein A [Lactobacillales bacterium]|nr:segregation/condensation protein A [Lactobacillales bacterium]